MPTRNATATWEGGLKGGKGSFKGESGAISANYSFGSRFESGTGSNPEELLAAAEAACFSMALSAALERAGQKPERVETKAACTIEKVGDGFKITRITLDTVARVPGMDRDAFKDAAEATKTTCPVSVALLGNVEIELNARLEE